MKGKYTKPLVMMESFSLTGGLLRDCSDMDINNEFNGGDPLACFWDPGNGMKIFLLSAACDTDGEEMEFGCYNNISEGSYIFRS